ncbi:ATP-binding protein [Luteolibacter ambystomatis]|uniref:ATP-binding protein n=1 Tax=Luteolibacter ambystomatis TaxID=2824561 RepID=A0A975J1W0_9BACT|nr:ATP-binding protein [Luteolibacter ambystomatis]QUE52476.1 ATP-binding protein [Luteolibacter ambystomatis]
MIPETTRAHVVCGPPACGKTTYARRLADRLGAVLLDSDEVAERLVRAGLALAGLDPNDRDSPAYKAAYRDAVYETLFDLARSNLPRVPVVVAGPFTSEGSNPDWPDQLKERLGTASTIHFVWCPSDKRRERILARGESRDLPKLATWDAYVASCRDERPVFPHVFVETS